MIPDVDANATNCAVIRESLEKKFKEQKNLLLKEFVKFEAFHFFSPKREFVETVVYNKILEIIKEFADSYVTINTLTNAGQSSHSLTLDFFNKEAKGTKVKGKIAITLCTCGTNFSATKTFFEIFEKKTSKNVFSDECYGTFWQGFIKNKEKLDGRQRMNGDVEYPE